MISQKIFDAALPYLDGKKLEDFRLGLNLACCKLSDSSVGVSHMFLEKIVSLQKVYPLIESSIGKTASELAEKLITGDMMEKTIATAVLNAASTSQDLADDDYTNSFGLKVKPADHITLIGRIPMIIKQFKDKVEKIRIYDMDLEAQGGAPDLSPMSEQKEGVTQSDILIITGTSILNSTLDKLLEMATKAREIIIVGPSTPMYPTAYAETKVTKLAGSSCIAKHYDEISKKITQGCNVFHLHDNFQKKCVTL